MRITQKAVRESVKGLFFAVNQHFSMTNEQLDEKIREAFPALTITGSREEKIKLMVKDAIGRAFDHFTK